MGLEKYGFGDSITWGGRWPLEVNYDEDQREIAKLADKYERQICDEFEPNLADIFERMSGDERYQRFAARLWDLAMTDDYLRDALDEGIKKLAEEMAEKEFYGKESAALM